MNDAIKYDLESLSNREYNRISVGITPSNGVHFGFAFTMISAFMYMQNHPNCSLEVCITDRDLDPQLGRIFKPYDRLEDKGDCHKLMRDHVLEELKMLRNDYCTFFGLDSGRINIVFFSDLLVGEPTFFAEIKELLVNQEKSRALKVALLDHGKKPYEVPFSPICPSCEYSNSHLGYVNQHRQLASFCYKQGCDYERTKNLVVVSIDDPKAYNLHYMIPVARDLFDLRLSPKADLHIFGGDFDKPHGVKKFRKYERVQRVMQIFGRELPDIFIGPELELGGRKISKSTDIFFPYASGEPEFEERFLRASVKQITRNRGRDIVDLAVDMQV